MLFHIAELNEFCASLTIPRSVHPSAQLILPKPLLGMLLELSILRPLLLVLMLLSLEEFSKRENSSLSSVAK
jgi:hypothetical protein